jgi:hypothetical protein
MTKKQVTDAARKALGFIPRYFNAHGEADFKCPAGHTFTVYRAVCWSSDRRITLALVSEALTSHVADQEINEEPCA